MSVHSYFELTTTLIGWHIANGIAQLLVSSGLIFVPFGVALYRNWAWPTRSQEAKNAASVSLRRMEQDMCIATVVVIFCFLPAVPIDPSRIVYYDSEYKKSITAADPNVPYMRKTHTTGEIRTPILWWLVYQISSLLTLAVVDVIELLGQPGVLRPILLRISQVDLTDEPLINEMRAFRYDCYEPSLAKYQNSDNPPKPANLFEDVDWLGSHLFLTTPGYYKKCEQVPICGTGYHANTEIRSWRRVNDSESITSGKPNCDVWWAHPNLGLRSKLLANMNERYPWFKDDVDRIRASLQGNDATLLFNSVTAHEDRFLRRLLNKAPKLMVNRPDEGKSIRWLSTDLFSIDGIQQVIGTIGALFASTLFHVIMEMLVIGLPMTQALMLMLLYVAIPLVVPYAVINPSIIVRIVLILFALRFVSALWALAAFLDEKLIETMYPDSAIFEFGGSGTTADIVLGLITLFTYLSLPIAWFLLMGTVSSNAIGSLGHSWGQISQKADSATESGTRRLLPTTKG